MNPETPQSPREQLEAKLTALLLGELPPEEAASLSEVLAKDAELAALHLRLKETIELVRETAFDPAQEPAEQPAPLKMSEARRQKLLAEFKTVKPPQFARPAQNKNIKVQPLVLVAAVLVIVVAVAGLMLPALSRAKSKAVRYSATPRSVQYVQEAGETQQQLGREVAGAPPNPPGGRLEELERLKGTSAGKGAPAGTQFATIMRPDHYVDGPLPEERAKANGETPPVRANIVLPGAVTPDEVRQLQALNWGSLDANTSAPIVYPDRPRDRGEAQRGFYDDNAQVNRGTVVEGAAGREWYAFGANGSQAGGQGNAGGAGVQPTPGNYSVLGNESGGGGFGGQGGRASGLGGVNFGGGGGGGQTLVPQVSVTGGGGGGGGNSGGAGDARLFDFGRGGGSSDVSLGSNNWGYSSAGGQKPANNLAYKDINRPTDYSLRSDAVESLVDPTTGLPVGGAAPAQNQVDLGHRYSFADADINGIHNVTTITNGVSSSDNFWSGNYSGNGAQAVSGGNLAYAVPAAQPAPGLSLFAGTQITVPINDSEKLAQVDVMSKRVNQFGVAEPAGQSNVNFDNWHGGTVANSTMTAVSSTALGGYVDTAAAWSPGAGNGQVPAYSFNSPAKTDVFSMNSVLLNENQPQNEVRRATGSPTKGIDWSGTLESQKLAFGNKGDGSQQQQTAQSDTLAKNFKWELGGFVLEGQVGGTGGTQPALNVPPSTANPVGFFPGTAFPASPDGLIPLANTLVPPASGSPAAKDKVPMLGDVPFLGGLFRSEDSKSASQPASGQRFSIGGTSSNHIIALNNAEAADIKPITDELFAQTHGTQVNGAILGTGTAAAAEGQRVVTGALSRLDQLRSESLQKSRLAETLAESAAKSAELDRATKSDELREIDAKKSLSQVQWESDVAQRDRQLVPRPNAFARNGQQAIVLPQKEPVSVSVDKDTGQLVLTTDDRTLEMIRPIVPTTPTVITESGKQAQSAAQAETPGQPIFATTAGTQGSPNGAQITYTNRKMVVRELDLDEAKKVRDQLQQRIAAKDFSPVWTPGNAPMVMGTKVEADGKLIAVPGANTSYVVTDNKVYQTVPEVAKVAASGAGQKPAIQQAQAIKEEPATPKTVVPPSIPQPEMLVKENAFSTFSLNVADVSFKLAAATLQKGEMPEPGSVRSEEFINAFDYRDPEPLAGSPIGFVSERTRYPFAHNRDLLRFSVKTAAAGRQAGRPLNIVLLLDNSGSMERADRVQIVNQALRVLAAQLKPNDRVSVISFARVARLWVDGIAGNEASGALQHVGSLTPEGGTNLEDAMNLAYKTALRHYLANGVNRVVLLTDGAANLGNVNPDALKDKVEKHRKQGVALDCFGIGWEGYNDDLLEVLSRNGDGRYGFINSPEEAAGNFAGQLAGALRVAASDVKVQVEFNPKRVTSYRQIGYAKHQLTKEQFRDNKVDAAEIGAAESGNALYTAEVNPAGEGPIATVRVRYKNPANNAYYEREWTVPYTGNAPAIEQSGPSMRLAATSAAFSEWIAMSPFAGEVTSDRLLASLAGVPEAYGADARPKQLEWMIRQAKAISGR